MRRTAILRRDGRTLLTRLQGEGGFGLIELLVAMVVTMTAVMALVAALSSSHVSLVRASRVSTAAAIASAELENYRALLYTDAGFVAGTATVNVTGADGRSYPTTITVTDTCPNGSAPSTPTTCSGTPPTGGGRPLKSVEVVVREPTTNAVLVRESSAFEELTGS